MKRAIMTVATLAAFAAASIPAIADDTGAATMHDLRKEGGRSCMVSHIHAGTGEGKTKARYVRCHKGMVRLHGR